MHDVRNRLTLLVLLAGLPAACAQAGAEPDSSDGPPGLRIRSTEGSADTNAVPESGPERLKKEVRISLQTNAPPATGATTNEATLEKSFQWDFSWRGWQGLHMEVSERTPLKNP